jgi:GNAT superfamily N-acetyltransferase
VAELKRDAKMTFRAIEPQDAAALIELRSRTRENAISADALGKMGITTESLGAKLRSTHRGWLCETEGRLAGFAMGDSSSGELWVIAVAPEFEGHGIGSRLLASVEQWLWSCGWDALWLWTDVDESRRAFAFYLHHGWLKGEVRNGAHYLRKKKPSHSPEP